MSLWTRAFWRATAERCVKTFSQTLAALLERLTFTERGIVGPALTDTITITR